MKPELSVIVVTFNTRDLTLRCVETFYGEALAASWEVIVVDNGSADGTAEAVAARFPAVRVIRSERNLGYAGAGNLGLQATQGRVRVLLNSDVLAPAAALRGLAKTLAENPDIGAISPGLRTPAGEAQPFAFGDDPTLSYLLRRGWRALRRQGHMHEWSVDHPIDVG